MRILAILLIAGAALIAPVQLSAQSSIIGCYEGQLNTEKWEKESPDDTRLLMLKGMQDYLEFNVCFTSEGKAEFEGSFGFLPIPNMDENVAYVFKDNALSFPENEESKGKSIPCLPKDYGWDLEMKLIVLELHRKGSQ